MPTESHTSRAEHAVAERRSARGARLLGDGGIARRALAAFLALAASPALGGCVLLNDYGGFTIGEPDAGGADAGGADASHDTPDGSADAALPADASSSDAGPSDAGPTDCTTPNTLYVATTGDDSNAGTIDAPLRSVAAAMARAGDDPSITNVYMSAGSFDTTYETDGEINLVDGLTLRGGYSDDFCTYAPATYVSEIVQGYLGGDLDPMEAPIVSVIGDDLPNGVVLEGFRVSIGEEHDDDHVGIRLRNTSAVIRDVTVAEGDGRLMTGIEIGGAASLTMERVTLAMDNASHGSTGIDLIDVVDASLSQIIVDRTVSETMLHSYGIRVRYGSGATSDSAYSLSITRSRIHGGRGYSSSAGITVVDARTTTRDVTVDIRNNLIHGGESFSPVSGIDLQGGTGDTTIYNNTIFTGESDAYGVGINYNYDFRGPDMRNNVVFAGTYCISQRIGGEWTGGDTQMSNNLFFDCDVALFQDSTNRITDVVALNALTNSTANQVASAVPLVSLAGPDSLVGTMANNDWGFVDGSPCTYTDGAYPVSDLAVDYFGHPRDETPSIGAIEFTGTCTP